MMTHLSHWEISNLKAVMMILKVMFFFDLIISKRTESFMLGFITQNTQEIKINCVNWDCIPITSERSNTKLTKTLQKVFVHHFSNTQWKTQYFFIDDLLFVENNLLYLTTTLLILQIFFQLKSYNSSFLFLASKLTNLSMAQNRFLWMIKRMKTYP